MPPHRRMRSYFLKLAHTFSTPLLSSLSTKSRAQDPQTRSRFLVHDFGLKRKSTTNFFPLPRLSLSTTSSFLPSFFFSLRSTSCKTVNEKFCRMEIQVSTERRLESEWPPAWILYARRKSISLERVHVHQASSWYSGTGWLEEVFTERNGANEIGDSL